MKSTTQIRIDAANLLESRDNAWTQRAIRKTNPDGTYAYCMIGACREAAGYYDAAYAYAYADAAARRTADAWRAAAVAVAVADAAADAAVAAAAATNDAAAWNDKPGRTRAEVIALLRNINE